MPACVFEARALIAAEQEGQVQNDLQRIYPAPKRPGARVRRADALVSPRQRVTESNQSRGGAGEKCSPLACLNLLCTFRFTLTDGVGGDPGESRGDNDVA